MARPNIADKVKNLAGDLEAGAPATSTDVFEGDEPRATKLRLADIEPDPEQPRVSPGDVSDLVASIKEHGLLQPLIVSPRGTNSKYRIIAGERRFTACNLVGIKVVDAIIRTDRDQNKLEIQLIENLHRKDLDPFEEAAGYKRLKDEFHLRDEDIARRFGKSRTRVTEVLSLTKLPQDIRKQCLPADNPLPRDTLFLIARQPTLEAMRRVMNEALRGVPRKELRDRARKGAVRPMSSLKRPRASYITHHDAVVIVKSLTSRLTREQKIKALKEALGQAKRED